MTREEAKRIIQREGLYNYNLFENRSNEENEVGICKKNGGCTVYITSERAGIIAGTERFFDNESDALENFIERLRLGKEIDEIEKRRKERAKRQKQ